jgi:hypothetical protein
VTAVLESKLGPLAMGTDYYNKCNELLWATGDAMISKPAVQAGTPTEKVK